MSRLVLSEIRDRVRTMTGSKNLSPDLIDTEIDQAGQQINREHRIFESSWYGTSVANKRQYALPKAMVLLGRVHFDDRRLRFNSKEPVPNMDANEDVQSITWTEEV